MSYGNDYCSYVTKMEKATSMCEGPHFPNLSKMAQQNSANKKELEVRTYAGRYGRSAHVEKTTTTTEEVDVTVGDYIKPKQLCSP